MLLKNTPLGDLEVPGDPKDEADIRAYVERLILNDRIIQGAGESDRATHRIIVEDGVKKLVREGFF
jgi:hypothetical protein